MQSLNYLQDLLSKTSHFPVNSACILAPYLCFSGSSAFFLRNNLSGKQQQHVPKSSRLHRKWNHRNLTFSNSSSLLIIPLKFIFRLLIVSMIGSQVYGDEQGQFKCDTNQPGCQNVCYNSNGSAIKTSFYFAFIFIHFLIPRKDSRQFLTCDFGRFRCFFFQCRNLCSTRTSL